MTEENKGTISGRVTDQTKHVIGGRVSDNTLKEDKEVDYTVDNEGVVEDRKEPKEEE